MRYLATTLLASGLFITFSFLLPVDGYGLQQGWIPLSLIGWAIAPYAVTLWAIKRLRSCRISLILLLIAATLLTFSSVIISYEAFIAHLNAQSSLTFMVLPIYQWIGLSPLLITAQRWHRAN
ncbi:MAG: hypothetical protein F6K04_27425 [Leptolyngbya sp. SIO4C5]|nr:hypothetical protein [Leptolyngbya sp. SIO4C5]